MGGRGAGRGWERRERDICKGNGNSRDQEISCIVLVYTKGMIETFMNC